MKKLSVFLTMILVVLALAGCAKQGEKPYKHLVASDVVSATVRLSPPNKTIKIDAIEKVVSLLNDIVIYEEDNTYGEYNGRLILFTLTMTDGTKQELQAYNPFFVINGTGYKTKYTPCEKLTNYTNELLSQAVDIEE